MAFLTLNTLKATMMARTKIIIVLEGPHAFLTRLGFVIFRVYDYFYFKVNNSVKGRLKIVYRVVFVKRVNSYVWDTMND